MKEKSERIHAKLAADRCRSRLNQVEEIVSSFRFSLPHPHDFCPSAADVCWVPEVRKAVVDGTEGEFQDCMADIRSRLPELSAAWLEERRQFFLRLLPQDSPTLKHLSLAITLFDCMKCHEFGMHIGEALSHHCRRHYSNGFKAQFSNAPSASVYFYDTAAPWDLGLAEYRHSEAFAALAREIVLECGENPDIITTREMNRKHHRFARFDTDGTVSVLNWVEAVSFEASSPVGPMPHLRHAASSSTSADTHVHHVGSSSPMNYQNMDNRKIRGGFGVASTVGGQVKGDPKRTTSGSASSKTTLLSRELWAHIQYTDQNSDVSATPGTKLRTPLKMIISTWIQVMPPRSNTDRERVLECLD